MEDGLSLYVHHYTEAVDATINARERAERDRDYYDGKQLTVEEEAELRRRGQPPIALNVIRARVDYLQGLEKKQRADPKAYPRNPEDQAAADAFSDGLRYVADKAEYPQVRSAVWKNIIVEGFGGAELTVEPKGDDYEIISRHVPWDRVYYDPHSTKADFSDARYLGQVLWLDEDEAIERAVANGADEATARQAIETTFSLIDKGDTYADKPRIHWSDPKRKRVRVCVEWCRKADGWHIIEFTKGGILSEMPSPFQSKDGDSLCLLVLESAYVDRDNNRYGVVRDLIDPQDEINKRRSKALHLINVRQVIADDGAVDDIEKARRELSRPDGWITKNPGLDLEIANNTELAASQTALGQQAMSYVMQSGPNAALLGKGTEDQSGRAIEAQQAGGLIELGDLMDALRRFDRRVYKLFAHLMQQFWTAERWIRVTDDDLAPQYVGLNIPQVEDTPFGPQQVGVENDVAALDMDVIVADAPDAINNSVEAYSALGQVMEMAGRVPPQILRVMIEAHPALPTRRKKQLLDMLEQMQQPQTDPLAEAERQAQLEKTQSEAFRNVAQGEAAMQRANQPQYPPMGQTIAA